MYPDNVPPNGYYSQDNNLNKPGMERREFYEETLERKQRGKNAQLTKIYYKARKEYYEFQKQISTFHQ